MNALSFWGKAQPLTPTAARSGTRCPTIVSTSPRSAQRC